MLTSPMMERSRSGDHAHLLHFQQLESERAAIATPHQGYPVCRGVRYFARSSASSKLRSANATLAFHHAPARKRRCRSKKRHYVILVLEISPKKVLNERSLRWNLHRRSFMMSRSSPSIVQVYPRNKRESYASQHNQRYKRQIEAAVVLTRVPRVD